MSTRKKPAHGSTKQTSQGAGEAGQFRKPDDAPPQDLSALRKRLAQMAPGMSQLHQTLARYLLAHPEEAAMASMRALAQRLSVDPSNLVRFAKALGFKGYTDLKRLFQMQLREGMAQAGYLARAARIQQEAKGRGNTGRLLGALQAANEANIANLAARNAPETLAECGRLLARARTIHVCGMRSCFAAAFAFAYAARMVRDGVRLMDGIAGTFADSLREIGKRDVLLVIGMAPYSVESVKAVNYAAERGAHVIALTDSPLSPLAQAAEHILEFPREGVQVPGTVMPAVALAETVVTLMIARGGKRFLDALHASEDQLARFGAYVPTRGQDHFSSKTAGDRHHESGGRAGNPGER